MGNTSSKGKPSAPRTTAPRAAAPSISLEYFNRAEIFSNTPPPRSFHTPSVVLPRPIPQQPTFTRDARPLHRRPEGYPRAIYVTATSHASPTIPTKPTPLTPPVQPPSPAPTAGPSTPSTWSPNPNSAPSSAITPPAPRRDLVRYSSCLDPNDLIVADTIFESPSGHLLGPDAFFAREDRPMSIRERQQAIIANTMLKTRALPEFRDGTETERETRRREMTGTGTGIGKRKGRGCWGCWGVGRGRGT
ncbi:hypothetical protein W97_03187 [Coniosporium apollinis CBS 100218]|uniref:Uncharacterized protein n=1 Tax=Coniosporium apollinis (strain CBS 100218) TaxID=1168221 RepID=R7YQ33_CONA1|nr:uncharacterized protein W97_03187 [Coniosporium apollinis CBS 100218]EON63958.1 hypothetical protein W97_03187 [Coniosporium apollinis CBS 100218]